MVRTRDVNRAEISGPARKLFLFGPAQPGINTLQNLYYGLKILLHIKIKFENITSFRF